MKYPLIAIPLSTLLVLTGCGGSGSGGDDAPVNTAPAPTVTVTAPASAFVNLEFDVAWTSTNATSCASTFSASTATSGSEGVTTATPGNTTYSVTCTGAGGSATGTANVAIAPASTAEGLWQGTGTSGSVVRNLSGVVTKENAYWLVYNGDSAGADAANAVGFLAGTGSSVIATNQTSGTFNSGDLREFNFEAAGALGGSLTLGTFDKSAADKATHTLAATSNATSLSDPTNFTGNQVYDIDAVTSGCAPNCAILTEVPHPPTFTDGGSAWTIVPSANQAIDMAHPAGIAGSFTFAPYTINVDMNPFGFPFLIDLGYPDRVLTVTGGTANWDVGTLTLTLTNVTFVESSPNSSCSDNASGAACTFVPGPSVPTYGDISITYTNGLLEEYTGVAHTYQLAIDNDEDSDNDGDISTGPVVVQCVGQGGIDACANGTLTFSGRIPTSSSLSQTVATTYDAAYETAPTLGAVTGAFSGSAGVDAAIHGSATFDIAADGSVTGLEATGCTYVGNVTPHSTGGNVYDVTLTFTAGGSCTYAGAFTGVATYDTTSTAITVTAVSAARDQGFLFSGTKAP